MAAHDRRRAFQVKRWRVSFRRAQACDRQKLFTPVFEDGVQTA